VQREDAQPGHLQFHSSHRTWPRGAAGRAFAEPKANSAEYDRRVNFEKNGEKLQIIDSNQIRGDALLTWKRPGGSPPLCAPAAEVVGNCRQGAVYLTDRLLWEDAGRQVSWKLSAEVGAVGGRRQ
jgi:hypothetical protein